MNLNSVELDSHMAFLFSATCFVVPDPAPSLAPAHRHSMRKQKIYRYSTSKMLSCCPYPLQIPRVTLDSSRKSLPTCTHIYLCTLWLNLYPTVLITCHHGECAAMRDLGLKHTDTLLGPGRREDDTRSVQRRHEEDSRVSMYRST